MKKFLVGLIVGLVTTVVFAQINTNDAVYGRVLGTGIATWLVTPSSANLASAITNETGSGLAVFGTNPAISITPVAVASLPSCAAGTANQLAIVNNALAPALGVAVSGAGALTVGVICISGTGWIVY